MSKKNTTAAPVPAYEWTTTKAVEPGSVVDVNGKRGTQPVTAGSEVATKERDGSMVRITFVDGSTVVVGAASKLWVAPPAGQEAPEAPKVEPEPEAPYEAPDGFTVVDLPTAKVVSAVVDALAPLVGQETEKAARVDGPRLLVSTEPELAAAVVATITAHMSAIVKADRSANMYAEGKLRQVRTAILAAVPGSEAGLPQRKTAEGAKADKLARVEALNDHLRAAREAKAARQAEKAAAAATTKSA